MLNNLEKNRRKKTNSKLQLASFLQHIIERKKMVCSQYDSKYLDEMSHLRDHAAKLHVDLNGVIKENYFEYVLLKYLCKTKISSLSSKKTFDGRFDYWLPRIFSVGVMKWLEKYIPMFLEDNEYHLKENISKQTMGLYKLTLVVCLFNTLMERFTYNELLGQVDHEIDTMPELTASVFAVARDTVFPVVEKVIRNVIGSDDFDVDYLQTHVGANLYDTVDDYLCMTMKYARRPPDNILATHCRAPKRTKTK